MQSNLPLLINNTLNLITRNLRLLNFYAIDPWYGYLQTEFNYFSGKFWVIWCRVEMMILLHTTRVGYTRYMFCMNNWMWSVPRQLPLRVAAHV